MKVEEKAKSYDRILSMAKEFNFKGYIDEECLYDMFPELKESEDEKIRKKLIGYFSSQYQILKGITNPDIVAWLEKQGEQNSTDKVGPKFRVDEFIVNDYCMGKVIKLTDDAYLLDTGHTIPFSCEHNTHLFTIEDAKDGDVLTSIGFHSNCIFIFNGIDNWKFDDPNGDRAVATGLCCITVSADNIEFGVQGPDCIEVNSVKPATKIERDLLFQKMKEAGYEWDAEKKELKKIEQKPADETSIAIKNEEAYRIGFADGEAHANEQKPAEWSEEDEIQLKSCIAIVQMHYKGHFPFDKPLENRHLDWLNSLKDRVQPEQEWSEEEEKIYYELLAYLTIKKSHGNSRASIMHDWVKSLRPQNQWKPSEEQMEALQYIYQHVTPPSSSKRCWEAMKTIELMHQELKKLFKS